MKGLLLILSLLPVLQDGTVLEETFVEGIVISAPAHPNLDQSVQTNYRTASATQNNRTAYIQTPDGARGLKLVFQHLDPEARKLERFSHVRINIQGAEVAEGGKVVKGIPNGAVVSVEPGSRDDVPLKIRRVRELTEDDLYTWVSIPDCEFVFKDGSYCNILESYAARPADNRALGGNGMMGTWQTLLTDDDGVPLYAVINSRVPWRRSGNGVPQGKGTFSGIYVRSDILRYGKVYAPQLRPLEEADFDFAWEGPSSFNTLCEWNWDDNVKTIRTEEGEKDYIKRQKVLPDKGEGRLYVDFEASTYRGRDVNNPAVEPDNGYKVGSRGQVPYGSLQVRTMAKNWWDWGSDCGNALVVKFSLAGITGGRLVLDFSFAAGDNYSGNTRMCPVYWGVEVSTDDRAYARIDIPDITCRALPWWERELDGVTYYTSAEAGMGLTEHQVVLPSSLFGAKDVWVRITPVRKNATTLAMYGSDNGVLRPNSQLWTYLEFGTIAIRYK
ncbi:MAG: hypothetical protein IJ721_03310 [Bacteroidales bacterium]|nr:hypothetical protein [Bacteroidales bacterium]